MQKGWLARPCLVGPEFKAKSLLSPQRPQSFFAILFLSTNNH